MRTSGKRGWPARLSVPLALLLAALLILPAAATAKRNVYVVGDASKEVAALDIGAGGILAPVAGSPFATELKPVSIAMTPDGRRVYVTNAEAPASVSAYAVTTSGGLAPIAGSFLTGAVPLGNAVTPSGRFMYVNNRDSGSVSAFEVHATGALTVVPGSPFAVGALPVGIAIAADGRFLFTVNDEGSVSALAIGADGTLAPVPGSPFASGAATAWAAAVTPDGQLLYTVNREPDSVSAFRINPDGSLARLPGFPIAAGGTGPNGIAIAPDGRHLYTMNAATIGGFAIMPGGGLAPVPGSPFAVPGGARSGALTPDGTRLYAAATGTVEKALGFAVGGEGSLATLAGSPFDTGVSTPDVQALAITPDQGPAASFLATPAAGGTWGLNASASSDPDGTVARYDWDFGDGTTAVNGGVAPSHTYRSPGSYRITLTVTDDEGCSTAVVFTGQTASCNGSLAARASADVTVPAPPPPVRKPKLKLRGAKVQALGKWVVVTAAATAPVRLVASGRLLVPRRSFALGKATAQAKGGKAVRLRLKLPKRARAAAAQALASGSHVRAKLTVVASAGGQRSKAKRTVRLRGPR